MSQNTTDEQAELSAFDDPSPPDKETDDRPTVEHDSESSAETTQSDTGEEDSDKTGKSTSDEERNKVEVSQEELPAVTVWDTDSRTTIGGATVLYPRSGDFQSLPGTTGISKHRVMCVIDGVNDYLKENDCRQIEVPSYYSDFDDFEPVVTKRTAASNDGARGITGPYLEKVIRYIAGKGGFKTSELSVFVGAQDHFLVTYDGDAFVVLVEDLSAPDSMAYKPTMRSVKGFEIPEDDPAVAAGLEPFLDAVEEYHGLTISDYLGLKGSAHRFGVADPEIEYLQIRGIHLQRFAQTTTDPEAITGEYTYETEFDEEFSGEITREDIPHEIGEEVRGGHVIGFSKAVSDPRKSSKASLSGRVKISVKTFYLLKRDKEKTDYLRFEVRDKVDRVAQFKPDREYDPINDPISSSRRSL